MPATSSQNFVKPLQFIEEATEGVTPTSSPAFTAIGAIQSFDYKKDDSVTPIGQIGPEDPIDNVKGQTVRESTINFGLTASTFLKRAVNAANFATPTGTISASMSLLYSIYLNGANERYIFLKGTRPKSVGINMEIGKPIECNMALVHTSIGKPISAHGLTTPTFASFATGEVWNWLSGGANPISWNSTPLNCTKFSCNIERNTSMDYTLGNTDGFGSLPHARAVSGEFTQLWTSDTEETDFDAGTERTLAAVLKTSVSTLTITNAEITSLGRSHAFDESGATVETFSYMGEAVTVT